MAPHPNAVRAGTILLLVVAAVAQVSLQGGERTLGACFQCTATPPSA
jgi:hypothetical protein